MKMKALPFSCWIFALLVGSFLVAPVANADVVGSIFLTGHDPDFHAAVGGNALGAQHINQAAINFIMDPTFNPFVAGGDQKFLFVECDTCVVQAGHVDGVPGITASEGDSRRERLSRPMARRTAWLRNWACWEQSTAAS